MLLYLVRHAIAVDHGTPGFSDEERPLTEKGSRRMAEIVRGLEALGIHLDAIWTSPLRRACQTADILATLNCEGANGSSRILIERIIELGPGGDFRGLIARIQSSQRTNSLALVGHEPSLSEFAGQLLIGEAVSPILLKKGAIACIETDWKGSHPESTLQWLMQPQALRRLSYDRTSRHRG